MPIKCSKGKIKYRIKRQKKGKAIRLAYCGNKVIEATPMRKNKKGKLKKVSQGRKMS